MRRLLLKLRRQRRIGAGQRDRREALHDAALWSFAMGVLPSSKIGQLTYFESHMNLWISNFASIGVTIAQANSFKTQVLADRAKYDAMQTARNASKAATMDFYNTHSTTAEQGRDLITAIKAYADINNNPNVLVLANIDPPAPPQPAQAPKIPTDLVGTISPSGVITLQWQADVSGASRGIFFPVERQRAGESDWSPLGGTMDKTFIDTDADVCEGAVSYRVRAARGNLFSEWCQPINFDLAAGPGITSNVAGFVGGGDGVTAEAA